MSVSIPNCLGVGYGDAVTLTCSDASKVFGTLYVTSQKTMNEITDITCSDKMGNTEQMCNADATDFDENDEIYTALVLQMIQGQCGFTNYSFANDALDKLPKDLVYKRKCSEILNTIADACIGYWFVKASGTLAFKEFATTPTTGGFTFTKHTKIQYGSTKGPLSYLIMEGNGKKLTCGSETTSGKATLRVSTTLANDELCLAGYQKILEYEYTSWSVEKALVNFVPWAGENEVTTADGKTLIINYGTLYVTAGGIYFSGGRNEIDESAFDYNGVLSDAIERRIAVAERFGNMQINGAGKMIIYVDKNVEES